MKIFKLQPFFRHIFSTSFTNAYKRKDMNVNSPVPKQTKLAGIFSVVPSEEQQEFPGFLHLFRPMDVLSPTLPKAL